MIRSGVYQHFKGKKYRVHGIAKHSETGELLAVYEPLYQSESKLWVRPLEMFTAMVPGPQGGSVPRFSFLSEESIQNTGQIIYLASPYTHSDKEIESKRYFAVMGAWRWLIEHHRDLNVFAPIMQSHHLSAHGGLPGDWQFWKDFDRAFISKCSEFWVLCIDGFKESVGVNAERQLAAEFNLPIKFLVPTENGFEIVADEPTL